MSNTRSGLGSGFHQLKPVRERVKNKHVKVFLFKGLFLYLLYNPIKYYIMKEFEVKVTLDVEDDDIEMTISKTQEMTIKDALTNFDNEDLSDRLELLEDDDDYDYDEELDLEVHDITVKSGDEIKSELEELIDEDLYEYIQSPFLYENFGVHGSASVNTIEITGINLDELREEAVKLSQKRYDEISKHYEGVIYKVK